MPIKYTCDKCGKEMFDLMDQRMKDRTTITEIEQSLAFGCSDCVFYEVTEGRIDLRRKGPSREEQLIQLLKEATGLPWDNLEDVLT